MKLLFSVCALLVVAVVQAEDEKYTDKYDDVNLDDILSNQRLYTKYFKCIEGTGKCTTDGETLRDIIPEALQTDCAKCSEKQKKGAEKVLTFLIRERADDFKILEDKYDPDGTYRKKYEEQRKAVLEGKPVSH